jgi:hypothetical protein
MGEVADGADGRLAPLPLLSLFMFHVVPQHGIDARLISPAFRSEELEHVRIEADAERFLALRCDDDRLRPVEIDWCCIGIFSNRLRNVFVGQRIDFCPVCPSGRPGPKFIG